MSTTHPKPRRVRVPGERNSNIYVRINASGKEVFEVGYRDRGRQVFETVGTKITAARSRRNDILGRKERGERVSSNRRIRFGDAADEWIANQVVDLRPRTQEHYKNSVENHLRPRWGRRKLEDIDVDDAARLIRELRAEGKSEHTIAGVIHAARRIFIYADRVLRWNGRNPITRLEKSERPKVSAAPDRRLFEGSELAETLAASREPFRTAFAVAGTTGSRLSETLGLVWADLDLTDLEEASIRFTYQVDRQGRRQPLKTEESRRTIEVPRSLAAMLARHKASSVHSQESDFVFATKSGRPLGQRNVTRELRRAMTAAVGPAGKATFPVLHRVNAEGKAIKPPKGSLPCFHGLRHTAASIAIHDGESAEAVSFQLGHRNSNVTRAVYIREIKSAERSTERRAKMEARYGSVLEAAQVITPSQEVVRAGAEVVDLGTRRGG